MYQWGSQHPYYNHAPPLTLPTLPLPTPLFNFQNNLTHDDYKEDSTSIFPLSEGNPYYNQFDHSFENNNDNTSITSTITIEVPNEMTDLAGHQLSGDVLEFLHHEASGMHVEVFTSTNQKIEQVVVKIDYTTLDLKALQHL
eukprot:TRINITY_DN1610_c0_g1_i9.p1 TRINITY_DN1610_c0_g1~~TRINITY_DN1610_c0_g1_i9.p1  ORF type:complete len:141 (-),score=25.18 TRINITY_DN1610_c0_g1_i9:63-485(-)